MEFDWLLDRIDAICADREFSDYSPAIAGWMQWVALAASGEW